MSKQFPKFPFSLAFYQAFRAVMTLVMLALFYLAIRMAPDNFSWAAYSVPLIPVAVPFLYRWLLGKDEAYHLAFYIPSMLFFPIIWPISAYWIFGGMMISFFAGAIWVEFGKSIREAMNTLLMNPLRSLRAYLFKPKSEKILKARRTKLEAKLAQLEEKWSDSAERAKKTREYVYSVEADLNHPMLSADNRATLEQLKSSLDKLRAQQTLMRDFFAKAIGHYESQLFNLEQKKKNQEILDYLKSHQAQDALRDAEKAQLDLEFEAAIDRLSSELMLVDVTQQAQGELFSEDLAVELEKAIKMLS